MNVLIIGCGQLGSRHAQSLAKHPNTKEITLIDPSIKALALAVERVNETGFRGAIHSSQEIEQISKPISLAIVSTSSIQRNHALKTVLENSSADNILLEKLLAPNLKDLLEISNQTEMQPGKFWVNCPMPYFNHYKSLKSDISKIRGNQTLKYRVQASNLGLVTNSIHYLDHFSRLTGRPLDRISIDAKSHILPSKRIGYSEVLGKISATTDSGDEFSAEFQEEEIPILKIQIDCAGWSWEFDELNSILSATHPDGSRTESAIETPFQSDLTHVSLQLLEENRTPHWSDLESSIYNHRLLLEALLARFGTRSDLVFT